MSSEATEPAAIEVHEVGKRYRYGTGAEGRLADALNNLARRMTRRGEAKRETFWALHDVSLRVERGEVVGVIGRNGAGKSTLLKLLSRITLPTEGKILMRGKVASLLEVGAGFDPQLSGRENVYLSGAILGMRRQEIAAKFDQIVEFSGIGPFVDTPVKRYSSGMFVRLAFSVGAHLDSDILLVDEVLAVGDAEFQHKCLAKMHQLAAEGRTIVFVSHNMPAIRRLCDRVYLLQRGQVTSIGRPAEVIAEHLRDAAGSADDGHVVIRDDALRTGSGEALLRVVRLLDSAGEVTDRLHMAEPFSVVLDYEVRSTLPPSVVELGIVASDGYYVATAMSTDGGRQAQQLEPGRWTVAVGLDIAMLPGSFALNAMLHLENGHTIDALEGVLPFRVSEASKDGGETYPWSQVRGSVRPSATWEYTRVSDAVATGGRDAG
jgi:lipopolysaccharide transport system ATP-binding protein